MKMWRGRTEPLTLYLSAPVTSLTQISRPTASDARKDSLGRFLRASPTVEKLGVERVERLSAVPLGGASARMGA